MLRPCRRAQLISPFPCTLALLASPIHHPCAARVPLLPAPPRCSPSTLALLVLTHVPRAARVPRPAPLRCWRPPPCTPALLAFPALHPDIWSVVIGLIIPSSREPSNIKQLAWVWTPAGPLGASFPPPAVDLARSGRRTLDPGHL